MLFLAESSRIGVNILPIAVSKKHNTKGIVVEKIYRPPVDKYCIEFPGGGVLELW